MGSVATLKWGLVEAVAFRSQPLAVLEPCDLVALDRVLFIIVSPVSKVEV